MTIPDELRVTFFQECEELLEALESGLMEISEGDGDDDVVNSVFRAVHSIKGGAGAFGLEDLVHFAHTFETTLDEVRSGRLEAQGDVMKTALRASDILFDLVRAAQEDVAVDPGPVNEVLAELKVYLPAANDDDEDEGEGFGFEPMAIDLDFDDFGGDLEDLSGPDSYTIRFKPHESLYKRGNETVLLFRALEELGTLVVVCDSEDLPGFDAMEADQSYLSWTVTLTTESDEEAIREIFEFVEDDCDLTVERVETESAQDDALAQDIATMDDPLTDAAPDAADEPADAPIEDAAAAPAEAEAEAEAETAEPPAKEAAKEATKDRKEAPKSTVRVDLDRVERLINLVGELVINQSVLSQQIFEAGVAVNSDVGTTLDVFKQLTRDIQESVMSIRAQPVKSLFQRMSRIVRESSQATGKSVKLIVEGETTEIDKTVVERLSDPLTHMIRNSVDHGLEMPERRLEIGKEEAGIVRLSAAHRSGRVIIEVTDDGAGINRERVKQIAIEKGLIPEGAVLSDGEIDNLLFMPGFSTAKEVSDLSGRGVGMDVVKRSIQALGGRISIASAPGKGSTFTISLPLTLAVLDGIVVDVAHETLVLPLNNVVETLKPLPESLHTLGNGEQVIHIRGAFLPIVDIGYQLGFRDKITAIDNQVVLLAECEGGGRSALVIDSVQDQRQVVIKGLQDNYGEIPGVSAATILGDGRIALILDVDALVWRAAEAQYDVEFPTAIAG